MNIPVSYPLVSGLEAAALPVVLVLAFGRGERALNAVRATGDAPGWMACPPICP